MRLFFLIALLSSLLLSCGTTTGPDNDNFKPTNLVATWISSSEVQLNWNDNSPDELGFIIQRKLEEGDYQPLYTTEPDTTGYLDNGVDSLNTYYYRVAALFDGFQSNWSNEVNIFIHPALYDLFFGTDSTFDIITWNIENFPKENQITVNYVFEIILALDADIIAMQEIESNTYFNDVVYLLNQADSVNTWEGYRAYSNLAYIYKLDQIEIIDIFEIYDSYQYNREFPRPPLFMQMYHNANEIWILNNHLKAFGDGYLNLSDPWDEETRRFDACNLLDDYIEDNLSQSNVIVIGDMNDELIDEQSNNVFWTFIVQNTEYLFTDMEIAQGSYLNWSYPSWPSHPDHILITNELFDEFADTLSTVETIKIDQYIDGGWNEYETNVSDHRPVGLKLFFE